MSGLKVVVKRVLLSFNLNGKTMKQTSKIVMVAVALLAGTSANAWANGTEVPPPAPPPYTPPPEPVYKPAPPPPVVKSDEGVYISLSGGLSLANNSSIEGLDDAVEYKTGYAVRGAIGLKMEDIRVEGEIGYHRNDVDKLFGVSLDDLDLDANGSMWTFMANAYYDIDTDSSIKPYVMAGAGLADATIKDEFGDESSSSQFAWQVGAGIGIKSSENVTFDLGYRYLKPSDGDFDGVTVSIGGSEILAGIRYQF
jgi:opacity protein-like surface antigen